MHKHFYESINGGKPTCIDDDIPFEIPDGWEWARLESICEVNPRNKLNEELLAGFIPMASVREGFSNYHDVNTKKWGDIESGYTHLRDNDVMVAKITPCFQNRKSAIVANLPNGHGAGSTEFHIARTFDEKIIPAFLLVLFKSEYFIQKGLATFTGTAGQQRISSDFFSSFFVALPPTNEQFRLVRAVQNRLQALNDIENSRRRYKRILSETPTSLRQQLIQAAIQGLLVPQNPNDEPASKLLERITEERTAKLGKKAAKSMSRIVRRGSKTYELFPDGSEKDISDEIPFDIPENWAWVRLGNLCAKIGAGSTPKGGKAVYKENGILFLRSQNVYNNGLRLEKAAFIEPAVDKSMAGSRVESLDLLLNITGASIGRCAIVPPEIWRANVNQHVLILRCIDKSMVEFVHTCIVAPFTFKHIMALQVGATKEGLSAQNASRLLLPIPPYAEQQRIVTTLNTVLPYLAL